MLWASMMGLVALSSITIEGVSAPPFRHRELSKLDYPRTTLIVKDIPKWHFCLLFFRVHHRGAIANRGCGYRRMHRTSN